MVLGDRGPQPAVRTGTGETVSLQAVSKEGGRAKAQTSPLPTGEEAKAPEEVAETALDPQGPPVPPHPNHSVHRLPEIHFIHIKKS